MLHQNILRIILFLVTIISREFPGSAFCVQLRMISLQYNLLGRQLLIKSQGKRLPRETLAPLYSARRDFLHRAIASLTTSLIFDAAGAFAYHPVANAAQGYIPDMRGGLKKPKGLGGLPKKIRSVGNILDELQRDLMQERWDLVQNYPVQLRSYVPVFTKYTDSAFPTDIPTDKGLRVALRYEVGRFFASLVRLQKATERKSLDEAYIAFANMSLHFDRYLHVGGLYTYYDATISNEDFYAGIDLDTLIYANQKKDPPLVRDLIVILKGPSMGKTGILIGVFPDESGNCVVKFDRVMGLREVLVLPLKVVAKRLGEQDPDDVFLIPRKEQS